MTSSYVFTQKCNCSIFTIVWVDVWFLIYRIFLGNWHDAKHRAMRPSLLRLMCFGQVDSQQEERGKSFTDSNQATQVQAAVNVSQSPWVHFCCSVTNSYRSSTNHFWPPVHTTSSELDAGKPSELPTASSSSVLLAGRDSLLASLRCFDRARFSPPSQSSVERVWIGSAFIRFRLTCLDSGASRITKQVTRQSLFVRQISFSFPFCNR